MGIQNTTVKSDIKVHAVKSSLDKISKNFHHTQGRKPVAGIDISVWIMSCLRNQSVVDQYHADPKVPMTAVSEHVMKRINLFLRSNWELLVVFDGQRNPLKAETNEKRKGDLEENRRKLARALRNQHGVTAAKVDELRKDTMWPRTDIYGEVIRCLKLHNIPVFGAPFEADHQLVSLQRQGMIDYVVSVDTDMPFLGISKTIYSFNASNGKCNILELDGPKGLFEKFFKIKFECDHVCLNDVRLFACLLGNDFVRQLSEQQLTYPRIIEIMKKWTALAPNRTTSFFREILQKYDESGLKARFRHALCFWKHAPAYFISPINELDTPRDAFQNGRYTVSLRSMNTDELSSNPQFYLPVEDNIGFNPFEMLRQSHTGVAPGEEATNLEFVTLDKWSRTGLEFEQIPPQTNNSGAEVFPGSIIHFHSTPVKFIHRRMLEIWLRSRGVPIPKGATRDSIEVLVHRVRRYGIDALPKACFRGGGSYITWAVLSPVEETNEAWLENDDALEKLRSFPYIFAPESTSLEPLPAKDSFVADTLRHMHNSRRSRCLMHVESGSFDLQTLAVSFNLKSDACPTKKLFVVKAECAPSQRIDTTTPKLYTVCLVFEILRDDALRLMKFPFSKCDCATGVGWCAHKGAMLLLTFLLRECFRDKCHSEAVQCLPCNVFSVAAQSVPLHYVYQNPRSQDEQMIRAIRRSIKSTIMMAAEVDGSISDSQTEPCSSSDDDDEDDESNDEASEDDESYADGDESDASALDSDFEPRDALDGDSMTIDLCGKMKEFAVTVEESLSTRDVAHHVNMQKLRQSASLAASLPTGETEIARKNIRLQRLHRSVQTGRFYPNMVSWYAADFVERSSANADDIDNIMDFIEFDNVGKLSDNIKRLDDEL